jgi:hypothetical protein
MQRPINPGDNGERNCENGETHGHDRISMPRKAGRSLPYVTERHLNYVNREGRRHFNRERPHEARGHQPQGMEKPLEASKSVRLNDVVYSSRLGGC